MANMLNIIDQIHMVFVITGCICGGMVLLAVIAVAIKAVMGICRIIKRLVP